MKDFKILLVYPNLQMVNLLPSNVSMLAACLKRAGFTVKLFDATLYKTAEKSVDEIRVEHMQLRPFNLKNKGVDYKSADIFEDFKKAVGEYQPDLIGVSATDDTYELGAGLISAIDKTDIHIIFGGIFPTFAPEEVIANPLVDSLCIGEGEEPLVELCQKLVSGDDHSKIKNLWVKKDGKVYRNPLRNLLDINTLPYEDFSIFEKERFFRPMQGKIYRMIPMNIDRGCPYACAFCAAPSQRKIYLDLKAGNYFRLKDKKRIMEELKSQTQKYAVDYIYFNSETFFAGKDEIIDAFAEEYSREIKLPFWCQTRIETVTPKRAKALKKMGCDRISIGLEHGNEEFRKKVLRKYFTNEQVVKAFAALEEAGIPVTVNNIIGLPDETRELVFDTIRLNRGIKADSINAYFFVPYHGTPLRQYCIEKWYLDPKAKTDSLMRSSILQMPQFPANKIKGLVRTFPLYVKMPESFYPRIKIAEQLNETGDQELARLRETYFKEYFK